jgi:GWxTD domain-containing protein
MIPLSGSGQAVNSINFSHWYDPLSEVVLEMKPVNQRDSVTIFFRLHCNLANPTPYLLKWEKKDSYSQRQGTAVRPADTLTLSTSWLESQFVFVKPIKPWILGVKVINVSTGKSWYFFKQIEAHHPVNGYLLLKGEKAWNSYLAAEERYTVHGSGSQKPIHFSYYEENFPTPSPPFVVKEVKMDRFLFPDSTFSASPGDEIGPFAKEGLYLAQEDTASALGFSFLIKKAPYPKYNKLADLKGPLLFVTTREENDALGAGEDKSKFDKIILDITKDKERARTFMRNYFKRVEFANYYFTSFKEGWKTDRGMIFIIFGRPDEVQVDGQYEVWGYKNPRQSFNFLKAGSVYHADHSVLMREKGYTEYWYQTIDLWRKSRF